ncbi:hypothetical protein [Paraburkholderia sp. HD33-4]|uniref:hypothetical protein n=1 Tax=Paraburkholderia sp. HD33-4 TaxID=2883242 RepID=UPI001F292F44|nr:hypothetical protein [Paraburkholderia sp. HD33-4]
MKAAVAAAREALAGTLVQWGGPVVIVGAKQDTLIPVAHARRFASEHDHAASFITDGRS